MRCLGELMRRLAVATAFMMFAVLCPHAAGADEPPTGYLQSNYEVTNPYQVKRDAAFSVRVPDMANRTLWAFGDIVWLNGDGSQTGTPYTYQPGTYLALSQTTVGQNPGPLTEVRTPDAPIPPLGGTHSPQPFFGTPDGLHLPGGAAACGSVQGYVNLPISWPLGLTQGPVGPVAFPNGTDVLDASQLVFMLVGDVCLRRRPRRTSSTRGRPGTTGLNMNIQRVRLVAYDVSANRSR